MIVEIYSKDACMFCERAKLLLQSKGVPFTEQKLGVHFTREAILEKFPTAQTFPIVVVDGFYIGGFKELNEQISSNTNQQLLNEGIRNV